MQLGSETAIIGYCHLNVETSADKQAVGENIEPTLQKYDIAPALPVYLSNNADYLPRVVQRAGLEGFCLG